MATHVLYIDDSGTKEYARDPSRYARSGRGVSRYFLFAGALVTVAEAGRLSQELRQLKAAHFGHADVEVKSNWLRIPAERKKRYLDRHGIEEGALRAFVGELYAAVGRAELKFIAAVIDKVHMHDRYGATPWYAPAVAYELILQRVEAELFGRGKVTVTIDNMSGATPRNRQYSANLQRQHQLLKQHGSKLKRGEIFTTIEGRISFVDSAHSDMVQVADLAAYNVHRQFVEHGEQWEDAATKSLPQYEYFRWIVRKFRCDDGGRIQGYGIVKFPLLQQVRWSVTPAKKAKAAP